MNQIDHFIKKLELAKDNIKQRKSLSEFEDILAEIVELHDVNSISLLIKLLDDQSDYDELMFSIIHSIEIFDDKFYVAEIIRALPELWEKSPKWCTIIHIRIFNSETTFKEYVKIIKYINTAQKEALNALIIALNSRSSKFVDKTKLVLEKIL